MKNILSIAFTGALLAAPALTHAKNDKKPGSSLEGYRFEFPCKGKMPAKPKKGAGCQSALVKGDPFKTDNFKKVVNFGGETGKTYKVTLRFRGVVEPMMYKNGKMDGDHFYIGGEPNNGTYNIYKIDVASPEIEGGSQITLGGDGQNGKLISNFALHVVPEIAPAPKPYHGQFIQIDVVKVEETK